MSPLSPRARALAAVAALVLAVITGLSWTRPPAPVPASAPPAEFSSARARAHIAEIARRPHRIGSAEHARVREYVIARLRALGLAPEIQETVVHKPYAESVLAVVRNVVAVKKGTGRGKALILVAHYDSRAMTPGATDDGFGVATLLETMRALSSGPSLASDIIVLITDGEEEGLLGARAFVTSHPLAAEAGVVINFEARGNAGPALMFQTSDDNGALIRVLAESAPNPAANSLSQAVYRRMPNDTDLTELLGRAPALNIANIGGFERYHAPTDTPENLDEATLQHHGSYALSLAKAFASRTLPLPAEPDITYFNAGPFFVHYAGTWTTPLVAVAFGLLAVFVIVASLCRAAHPGRVLLAFITLAIAVLASAALAVILWLLADALHADYALINAARPALKALFLAAFLALALAIVLATAWLLARRTRPADRFAAAAALFCALAALAASYMPGAAFLFTWPAILALLIGTLVVLAARTDPFENDTPLAVALQLLAPLPAIALVAPFIPQLHDAFGPQGAAAPVVFATLLFALAAPALRHLGAAHARAPIAALTLAAALYAGASLLPPFDRAHPRPDSLFFAVDADHNRAFWLSADRAPDGWTSNVLDHASIRREIPLPFPFSGAANILTSEVTAVREPAPEIAWLDDGRREGRGGAVRVRITPPPGAELLAVRVEGAITTATVAGHALSPRGGLAFRFYAPPPSGVEIELKTATADPITVRAVSQRDGFPETASPQPGPRPPGLMARPGMMAPWNDLLESDMTIVARTSTK